MGLAAAVSVLAAPAQTVGSREQDPLPLAAASAILVDEDSGRILYQKNPDQVMVPASLAKLMTLHLVYQKLEDRTISRSDIVTLYPSAWADHQAPGSTVMNLGPGQIVTVEELMLGAAIMSGNDAATALAEYVAGSTSAFVAMMNDEARFMGYRTMHFVDPAGVDPANRVTAREFADFCRRYIALHPEALPELHAQREFEYPLAQNMPGVRLARLETKKQYNGNWLVWDGIGVDGLKTGHLDNENFTAAITARRDGMRLIAVLLGVPGTSLADGARRRTADSVALLTYGFHSFSPVVLDLPSLPPVRVWKGGAPSVAVRAEGPVRLTLRPEERDQLTYMVLASTPLVAPVYKGQKVGDLVYSVGADEVARLPLYATRDVTGAGPVRWTWDSIVLGLTAFVENARAATQTAMESLRPTTVVAGRTSP
ncbi:MAG TPA: D-alanyl-D-alanine carboxypeptidase family protein [Spirochaetia bacterium]|nr:D-alanyl-D-alanine carboxypeptidase family protein [Spirochaetia bacterium]